VLLQSSASAARRRARGIRDGFTCPVSATLDRLMFEFGRSLRDAVVFSLSTRRRCNGRRRAERVGVTPRIARSTGLTPRVRSMRSIEILPGANRRPPLARFIFAIDS
jgi:hypothetical protein